MKSGSLQPNRCAKSLLNNANSSCLLISVLLIALMPVLLAKAQTGGASTKENESQNLSRRLTVAVLPFENKASDKQASHWRYGIQRMLEEQLRIVKAVRLLPRDSAEYAFKQLDLTKDASVNAEQAKRIGEIMEAQRIVWGGYRKENNQWQVQVRILNVASGRVSGELIVTSGDLFEVRDKLIEKILHELAVIPPQEERQNLGKRQTASYDALEYCSKALELQEEKKPLAEQEDILRKAVAADGQFAQAYIGLAAVLATQGKFKEAEEAVRQALKIDPNDSQAHVFLGTVFIFQDNFTGAEMELQKAYSIDPDDSEPLVRLGEIYFMQNKLADAIAITEKARLIDFANAAIYAKLGYLYARNRERDKAMSALKEAERLSPDNVNAEQLICQVYEILGEIPSAVEHYERFLLIARQMGENPKIVAYFEKTAQELKETLTPTYVKLSMPKVYTDQELQKTLRDKLSESELRNVVNPIASNPEMKRFAQQITKDANSDFNKAKAIFDVLMRRIRPPGKGGTRTAKEVFNVWKDPNESFSCQEYAKLYGALARDVDVNVFYVHVDKMFSGRVVHHDCAAVFLNNNEALLVDPAQYWFGVPHKDFEVLDDLQAFAHHLYQSKDLSQCQLAAKLQPDSAWGHVRLGHLLRSMKRKGEARSELEVAKKLEPNDWDIYLLQGVLEGDDDNFEAATNYIRKALALNPESAEGHYFLGLALMEQGKLNEAKEEYRACLKYEPTDEMTEEAQKTIIEINELNPESSAGAKDEFADLMKKIKPAVVFIRSFDVNGLQVDEGSGFFINSKGHIVTSCHIIEGASSAMVKTSDGNRYPVRNIIACDIGANIVKLDINIPDANVVFLELNPTAYKSAELVLVAVNKPDFKERLSTSIISAGAEHFAFGKIFRLTPAAAPFSSGSPIINKKGEVIGIVASIHTEKQNFNSALSSRKILSMKDAPVPVKLKDYAAEKERLNAQRLYARGLTDFFLTDFQDALEYFQQVVAKNPEHAWAHLALGFNYFNLNRFYEAIEVSNQAIKINPDFVEAYYNLAVIYFKLGRSEEAMKALNQCIKINPGDAYAHNDLGAMYIKMQKYQEGVEYIKQAIKNKPDYAEAYSNLGYAYLNLDRYEEAMETLKQAIKINPDYAVAFYNLGLTYGRTGHNREAVDAFNQAVKIKPDYAEAHYWLGVNYLAIKNKDKAIEEYKILQSLNSQFAEELRSLIYK